MSTFDKTTLLEQFESVLQEMTAADESPAFTFKPTPKPDRKIFPVLYLPVEVKARELRSKALIARQAKQAGFTVFMGASWTFPDWIPHLPPGIALLKSSNVIDAKNMAAWIGAGHMTAVLDEEIFGVLPRRDYLLATFHPKVAAFADIVYAQGQAYVDAFPFPVSPVVTGNPRILTYDTAHGDDILVCLQSGNINNNGPNFAESVRATLRLAPSNLKTAPGQAWATILRESIAHECDSLPIMQDTILALSRALPDRTIRVRAHPVENPDTWHYSEPNIVMDESSSIGDAMRQSATLVYVSGCTTGVDAFLARLPAVRIGSGGQGISAEMHAEARTPQQAVDAVRRNTHWNGDMSRYFAPINVLQPLTDLLNQNAAAGQATLNAVASIKVKDFHRRKFPDTTAAEVTAMVGFPATEIAWNVWQI